MTARSEDQYEDRPGMAAVLSFLSVVMTLAAMLAFSWVAGHWSGLLFAKPVGEPPGWRTLLVVNVLISVGAISGLLWLRPLKIAVLMLAAVLATGALGVLVLGAGLLKAQLRFGWPWPWQVKCMLAVDLLVGIGAIWGLLWLRPWQALKGFGQPAQPISPSTLRAGKLGGLKELLGLLAIVSLAVGAFRKDHPFALLSNSPVPLWIAMEVIACWLLARLLREWWHYRADEHLQRASDFGRRVAAGLFFAVTPAWWVAARAGLLPEPNAMILWLLTWVAASIAFHWRRYR